MLRQYFSHRKASLFISFILFLLIAFWFIVYAANGTSTVFPYLFFIPILLTSFHVGLIPSVIVAIISGIAIGPFMYLDVAAQVPQSTTNWFVRMLFLVAVATLSGVFAMRLNRLVYKDELTGLGNRRLLEEHMNRLSDNSSKRSILFLNIDMFHSINDSMGYRAGDMLLKEIAERIKNIINKDDVFIRWGGDEFVLWLESAKDKQEVEQVIYTILSTLHDSFLIEEQEVAVTTKIGISQFPDDGESMAVLINNADMALQFAKDHNKRFAFYNNEMKQTILKQRKLEKDLKQALKNEEFELYYQPKINTTDGKINGAEAINKVDTFQ